MSSATLASLVWAFDHPVRPRSLNGESLVPAKIRSDPPTISVSIPVYCERTIDLAWTSGVACIPCERLVATVESF